MDTETNVGDRRVGDSAFIFLCRTHCSNNLRDEYDVQYSSTVPSVRLIIMYHHGSSTVLYVGWRSYGPISADALVRIHNIYA